MMAFSVLPTPKDEKEMVELSRGIVEFILKNVQPIDVEGFILSWLNGVQIIKETDNEDKIIGVAIYITGRRWLYRDKVVTILLWKVTNEEGFFSFIKSIAAVTGASRIIYEKELLSKTETEEVWAVRDVIL